MTTTILSAAPTTVESLMFSTKPLLQEAAFHLAATPVLQRVTSAIRLPNGVRGRLAEDILTAAASVTRHPIAEILVAAWRGYAEVMHAAKATAAHPTTTQWVRLGQHRAPCILPVTVELLVNGSHAATVNLEVEVVLTINTVGLQLREGRLVAVETGHCSYEVILRCEAAEVTVRRGEVDTGIALPLTQGMVLVPPRPAVA